MMGKDLRNIIYGALKDQGALDSEFYLSRTSDLIYELTGFTNVPHSISVEMWEALESCGEWYNVDIGTFAGLISLIKAYSLSFGDGLTKDYFDFEGFSGKALDEIASCGLLTKKSVNIKASYEDLNSILYTDQDKASSDDTEVFLLTEEILDLVSFVERTVVS